MSSPRYKFKAGGAFSVSILHILERRPPAGKRILTWRAPRAILAAMKRAWTYAAKAAGIFIFAIFVLQQVSRDSPPPDDGDLIAPPLQLSDADNAYFDYVKINDASEPLENIGVELAAGNSQFDHINDARPPQAREHIQAQLAQEVSREPLDLEASKRLLKRCEKLLAYFKDFSSRVAYADPEDGHDPFLNNVIHATLLDARVSLAERRPDTALEDYFRLIDVGRVLSRSNTRIAFVLCTLKRRTALHTLRAVESGALTKDQLLAIAKKFSSSPGISQSIYSEIRGGYAVTKEVFLTESGLVPGRIPQPREIPGAKITRDAWGTETIVAETGTRSHKTTYMSRLTLRDRIAESLSRRMARFRYFLLPYETCAIVAEYARLELAEAEKPALVARAPSFHHLGFSLKPNIFGRRFLNGVFDQYPPTPGRWRFVAAYDGDYQISRTALVAALTTYHLDHKNYPNDLKELAPAYIPNVPAEPYTGGPWDYSPKTGQVRSLGRDRWCSEHANNISCSARSTIGYP